jgi:hypothetical protein
MVLLHWAWPTGELGLAGLSGTAHAAFWPIGKTGEIPFHHPRAVAHRQIWPADDEVVEHE